MHGSQVSPLDVEENSARLMIDGLAPVHAESNITALAVHGDLILTGDEKGEVIFHRSLPLPIVLEKAPEPTVPDDKALVAFTYLTEFLTGRHDDGSSRSFPRISTESRLKSLQKCDFEAISAIFPDLDFSPIISKVESFQPVDIGQESTRLLEERLTDSVPADPAHFADLQTAFDNADDEAVARFIQSAGTKGSVAAKALEFALASTRPDWIRSLLGQAEDLPPLVRKLAVSRIAWLEGRKADAIAGWPDAFPDLPQVRLREDWHGWEQADFSPALEILRLCVAEELDAIKVPENPTPEQRKALYERLTDPKTVNSVGKPRYARACLNAALAFSAYKDETATTFHLASVARNLGEAAEPCLRAEALALTALGDYQNARERWIALITEHPVDTHLPGDYAEAAYTSFENADPRQAMEILTTGLHRFPNDANFALRAGWVALLTGNAERAYRFLLTGRQIGYPDEKLENAVALMAIAAVQTGASEDAAVFYQELIRMDPAWQNPDTIETLEWPEELRSSLRQLIW
jgi:tetratricopeptide (TPR) repeat protein